MKVLLLKPVKNLGNFGDVVDVARGYARNYLIPSKIALFATKSHIEMLQANKQKFEQQNAEFRKSAEENAKMLAGKHFDFIVQASGTDNKLFGSISVRDIAQKISKFLGYKVEPSKVTLDSPIKYVGVHKATVVLYSEVDVSILVVVARSESDIAVELDKFTSLSS